jgi:hypothetical protein
MQHRLYGIAELFRRDPLEEIAFVEIIVDLAVRKVAELVRGLEVVDREIEVIPARLRA